MTTVAWDGKCIAADRQCGGYLTIGKLFRLKSGAIVAGAGYYDQVVEIVAWMDDGAKPDHRPRVPENLSEGSNLLLIDTDGTAYWLTWPYLRPVKINESFAAIGSGSEFALGAMAMGASAKRAVEIACRFDPSTGKGINVIRVRK